MHSCRDAREKKNATEKKTPYKKAMAKKIIATRKNEIIPKTPEPAQKFIDGQTEIIESIKEEPDLPTFSYNTRNNEGQNIVQQQEDLTQQNCLLKERNAQLENDYNKLSVQYQYLLEQNSLLVTTFHLLLNLAKSEF